MLAGHACLRSSPWGLFWGHGHTRSYLSALSLTWPDLFQALQLPVIPLCHTQRGMSGASDELTLQCLVRSALMSLPVLLTVNCALSIAVHSQAVLMGVLDRNKHVQEAACSSLATVEEAAGPHLEGRLQVSRLHCCAARFCICSCSMMELSGWCVCIVHLG